MQKSTANMKLNKDVTTLKVSSFDLILLSKVLADLHARFNIFSQSRIMVNDARCFFCFVNLKNSEVAERLQEISPYPLGA
jgi:hypothetical protein